jgi:hypothetical protein
VGRKVAAAAAADPGQQRFSKVRALHTDIMVLYFNIPYKQVYLVKNLPKGA